MVQYKLVVLWWLINTKEHPSLNEEDRKIENLEPLIEALFPGANYIGFTEFHVIMGQCVMPALTKKFPELLDLPPAELDSNAVAEISTLLPCKGHEWYDSKEWQAQFKEFLKAESTSVAIH